MNRNITRTFEEEMRLWFSTEEICIITSALRHFNLRDYISDEEYITKYSRLIKSLHASFASIDTSNFNGCINEQY